MSIYSRIGNSEFIILSGNLEKNEVTAKRISDGMVFVDSPISEFWADNGLKEIDDATKEANKKIGGGDENQN